MLLTSLWSEQPFRWNGIHWTLLEFLFNLTPFPLNKFLMNGFGFWSWMASENTTKFYYYISLEYVMLSLLCYLSVNSALCSLCSIISYTYAITLIERRNYLNGYSTFSMCSAFDWVFRYDYANSNCLLPRISLNVSNFYPLFVFQNNVLFMVTLEWIVVFHLYLMLWVQLALYSILCWISQT